MAINKFMKVALKALSYPDIDVRKTYHLERTVKNLKIATNITTDHRWRDCVIQGRNGDILTRIYTPKSDTKKNTLLFFHGGGWVTENINTYHKVCYALAHNTESTVISVDYRLAPENPFPKGFEDCYDAAKALFLTPEVYGIETHRITLVGDSAGGNLAAAVSLKARDDGEFKIPSQVLIYPATYYDHSENSPFDSVRENGDEYLLTSRRIFEYIDLYKRNDDDLKNPYFSPLMATDFSNQPETLLISAEFDPLRDEGEEYGRKLQEAGNKVKIYRMKDALHGFLALGSRYVHVQRAHILINLFLDREII